MSFKGSIDKFYNMYTVKIGDGDVHDFIEDIGKIYEFINTELDSKIKLEFIKNCKKNLIWEKTKSLQVIIIN